MDGGSSESETINICYVITAANIAEAKDKFRNYMQSPTMNHMVDDYARSLLYDDIWPAGDRYKAIKVLRTIFNKYVKLVGDIFRLELDKSIENICKLDYDILGFTSTAAYCGSGAFISNDLLAGCPDNLKTLMETEETHGDYNKVIRKFWKEFSRAEKKLELKDPTFSLLDLPLPD